MQIQLVSGCDICDKSQWIDIVGKDIMTNEDLVRTTYRWDTLVPVGERCGIWEKDSKYAANLQDIIGTVFIWRGYAEDEEDDNLVAIYKNFDIQLVAALEKFEECINICGTNVKTGDKLDIKSYSYQDQEIDYKLIGKICVWEKVSHQGHLLNAVYNPLDSRINKIYF